MHNKYIKQAPAKQQIDNKKYAYTRKILYQSLGLRKNSFENSKILEVGPGHGYNALVNMEYNPEFYKLVELNQSACKSIYSLFQENNINASKYEVINSSLEEFEDDIKYDIVICEGTLAYLKNKYNLLRKLTSFVKKDGILILTSTNEISQFYDMSRRLLANQLGHGIDSKNEKISIFTEAFKSHTETLNGFSKIVSDWCKDLFLGNEFYNNSLDLEDILETIGNNFIVYNMASPNLIPDERWYRQIPENNKEYNKYLLDIFHSNSHNLFHYKLLANRRNKKDNINLKLLCKEYTSLISQTENSFSKNNILIINILEKIRMNLNMKESIIDNSLCEISELLKNKKVSISHISNMKYFKESFGRGSQYISLIKNKD